MAQRDTDMCDVSLSPEAAPATDVGGADRGAAAAAHALWTERYQPRRPAQVHGACTAKSTNLDGVMTESTRASCKPMAASDMLNRAW